MLGMGLIALSFTVGVIIDCAKHMVDLVLLSLFKVLIIFFSLVKDIFERHQLLLIDKNDIFHGLDGVR